MSSPHKIINLKGRDIVFRKCRCKGYVIPTVLNKYSQRDELFYCNMCKKMVTQFITNFKIDMTLLDLFNNRIQDITLYDQAAANFMGCTSDEYLEHTRNDEKLYEKLEDLALGLFVQAELLTKPSGQIKVKSLQIMNPNQTKLIDILIENQQEYNISLN